VARVASQREEGAAHSRHALVVVMRYPVRDPVGSSGRAPQPA